jgi:hypothetical protein
MSRPRSRQPEVIANRELNLRIWPVFRAQQDRLWAAFKRLVLSGVPPDNVDFVVRNRASKDRIASADNALEEAAPCQ